MVALGKNIYMPDIFWDRHPCPLWALDDCLGMIGLDPALGRGMQSLLPWMQSSLQQLRATLKSSITKMTCLDSTTKKKQNYYSCLLCIRTYLDAPCFSILLSASSVSIQPGFWRWEKMLWVSISAPVSVEGGKYTMSAQSRKRENGCLSILWQKSA